jgi:hypothetical protein
VSEQKNTGCIVEFIAVGKSVKVTAIDPVTLLEVSIIGSTKASRKQLSALAMRKLTYMLKKNKDSDGTAQ